MTKAVETDLFPWILGVFLIAASAIAAGITTGALERSHTPSAALSIVATPKSQAAALPPTSVQSTARPPLPRGQVWQCIVNGQPTFSDSPCSNSASVRHLSQVNRMDAVLIPIPVPAASYNSPAQEYAPAVDDGNDLYVCQSLKAEVRSIDDRMRNGYTLPEGDYLRARLREISDIQYQRTCLR